VGSKATLESRYAPPAEPGGRGCALTAQCAPASVVMYAYRFETAAQTDGEPGWVARLRSEIGVPSTVVNPVVVWFVSCQSSVVAGVLQRGVPTCHV
jgi:hypothetical protein